MPRRRRGFPPLVIGNRRETQPFADCGLGFAPYKLMRGLKDKVCIVTGGLGDLGWATGVRLREEGCKVALLDVKPDVESRAAKIAASFHQVDISNESQVQRGCRQVERELGAV